MKFLGIVNHRPKFFAPDFAQNSAHPKKFFAHNFAPDFSPILAQPAGFPLRSLSAFDTPRNRSSLEAQTSRNTPSSSLLLCAITCRLATITCVIKMKDRGSEQCSQNKTFFHYEISRMRFCRGCGIAKGNESTCSWSHFNTRCRQALRVGGR